jgi:hypothetical protein
MLSSSKKFRTGLLGTAAVALMGASAMMASTDANATAYAYSALDVNSMLLSTFNADGTNTGNGIGEFGGFTSFQFRSKGLSVELGAASNSSTDINTVVTTSGSTQNQTQLCLGDCGGFSDNNYFPPPAINSTGNVAVADSHMTNTVLNGSANFGVQGGAVSNGGGTVASGSTLAGTSMNWNFSTGADDQDKSLSLNWNEIRHLQVATTKALETAEASLLFNIEIRKENGQFVSIFDAVNDNPFTSLAAAPDNQTVYDINVFGNAPNSGNINLTSDTFFLDASSNYELRFTFNAAASATSFAVPEPGALGLLGAGLLGLGVLQYRRRRKAAA